MDCGENAHALFAIRSAAPMSRAPLRGPTPFQQAVDGFLREPKAAAGTPRWEEGGNPPDQESFWPLTIRGEATGHTLRIEARLATPLRRFCVMVGFEWMGEEVVVARLNFDPDEQTHINRQPRPLRAPAMVSGPRYFPWRLNRLVARPAMRGLPFAIPLDRKHHSLDNAIRFLAHETGISLENAGLPDYPVRKRLL